MDEPAATDVRRLPRRGLVVRGVVTAAALAVLGYAQYADSNDLFPLGVLSQYANARDLDGTVTSLYLEADAGGERVRVPLNQQTVGVGRAEIEGQLDRILADPELLEPLADAYAEAHPGRAPLDAVYLMRSTQQLRDGLTVGIPAVAQLTSWTVVP